MGGSRLALAVRYFDLVLLAAALPVFLAADLPIAGQLAPGDTIEFSWASRQEAAAALIARERSLLRISDQYTA